MDNRGEIIIYQTEDGLTKINVNLQNETVWLSLDQMAELFQRDKSTISRHMFVSELLQILQQFKMRVIAK